MGNSEPIRRLFVSFVSAVALMIASADRAPCQEIDPGPRTWTDRTGNYTVLATFVGLQDNQVSLKKENGEVVDVPLTKLSQADRRLAEALGKQMRPPAKSPENGASEKNPFASKPRPAEPPPRQDVIREVGKAITYIATRDHFGRQIGLGSGFVVEGSGLVATNYHVIKNATSASVKFRDGTEMDVAGYRALDKKRDLAILQLKKPPNDLSALKLKMPEGLTQGDSVIAIGHPQGFEFTASSGIISAIRKTAEMPAQIQGLLSSDPESQWLQISAPISVGSSGGPLLNRYGEVLGVNTWIAPGQNLGFAIHVRHLLELKEKLPAKPHPLPVPGSFQGPSVTESAVLDQLAELRRDWEEFLVKLGSVQDPAKRSEIAESENPIPSHLPRLRKLAEDNPATELGFQALVTITRLARDESKDSADARKWAMARLLEHHANAESLGGLALELCGLLTGDAQQFQRAVIQKSPHNEVKGLACMALATALGNNPKTRGRGEDETIEVLERAVTEFGEIEIGDTSLRELANPMLIDRKFLSVGRTAPNIAGKDSKGQEFQLSDYRGKVVLLDFWVDWCPYCRQMYPQERQLTKEHAGKPFVILGVNCDKLSRLRSVEQSKNVTWRSWADGPGGPIAKKWNITGYPTLYLLDHRGKIRLKGNIKGKKLDAAVDLLLDELERGLAHDLVEPCSVWSYLDDGTQPGNDWRKPEFDDSAWHSGRAPLGYGDDDETTVVRFGPNPKAKHITTYFRHTFELKDPSATRDLVLGLTCDDGAAVFLNGQEVARENLAAGAKHTDKALKTSPDDGQTRHYFDVDPKLLRGGTNVLAVEVHQSQPGSTDLRFDLTLGRHAKTEE